VTSAYVDPQSRPGTEVPQAASPAHSRVLRRKCAGKAGGCTSCASCKEDDQVLHRSPDGSGLRSSAGVPQSVHESLASPGEPLDRATREFMESRFAHDFSRVRVHTGGKDADSAHAVDALAYSVGPDIVFEKGQYAPGSHAGRRLLAHELAHVVQQPEGGAGASRPIQIGDVDDPAESEADSMAEQVVGGVEQAPDRHVHHVPALLRRRPAGPPTTETEDCEPSLQNDLSAMHPKALARVDLAVASLAPGWDKMQPSHKAAFSQYFDPSGSGDIDDGFVRDVRRNYAFIRANMNRLSFDCDPDSRSVCGTSHGWCKGGRLMWTCFGNVRVCSAAYKSAAPDFKIATIIHESTHNALLTTDRAYSNEKDFNALKPRGGGFWGSVLNFLGRLPVLGILFRALPGNNDTINNPDSYSEYAMQV
jgi:uncharacterized protein DUF4157